MIRWSAPWVMGVVLACAGTPAQIPSLLVDQRFLEPAAQRQSIAILPLVDARKGGESPDDKGKYVYRRRLFRGTNLDWLAPEPMEQVTRAFAQALVSTSAFARVELVRDVRQARRSDLVLSAKVLRARGYVEDVKKGEVPWILAEVVLSDIEIRSGVEGPLRFSGATGWSVWRQARSSDPEPLSPWWVLGATLQQATQKLADVLRTSNFESFEVPSATGLAEVPADSVAPTSAATAALVPRGWKEVATATATPAGWAGEGACEEVRLAQRQALRFHRVLGPYVPMVLVWSCPSDVDLRWQSRAEYPAKLLGRSPEGWVFGLALGASNWRSPLTDLRRVLAIDPVPDYVIRVSKGGVEALVPPKDTDFRLRRRGGAARPLDASRPSD